jgi:serine phosphatase RsbU (regulator of sigma subunit)
MEKFTRYKHTKLTGLILLALCFLFTIMMIIYQTSIPQNGGLVFALFVLLIMTTLNLGFSFLVMNKSPETLKKVINNSLLAVAVLILVLLVMKYLKLNGIIVIVIFICFYINFFIGPLVFIKKYEKWKYYARSSNYAVLLSVLDLLGKTGLITGLLFKLTHWPGSMEMMIGGGILFVMSYLLFNNEFQKEVILRKKYEDELKQSIVEINAQKEEIENQRNIVEKQNEDIVSSIKYAERIQKAVLPADDVINEILPEHFLLNLPRDIVSGDFYWIKEIKNFIFVAVADCTGHGVPGAFMSMLGVSFINEIVTTKSLDSPGAILDRLRSKIKKSLKQQGKENEQKDGMDIAFFIIDKETLNLQYSGAYNPLYVIRPGNDNDNSPPELHELKPDRQPVSVHPAEKNFTTCEFQLQKGDCIYAFSDGYADQFGGEGGIKFKYSKFKELLLNLYDQPMSMQKGILEDRLRKWRGPHDQIDDILIIGIRI